MASPVPGRRTLRLGGWLVAPLAASIGVAAFAQQPSTSASAPQVHQAEAAAGAAPTPERMKAGEEVYKIACIACHQATGEGMAGAFPPLAKSDFLMHRPDRAVGIFVRGLTGGVTVNDVT